MALNTYVAERRDQCGPSIAKEPALATEDRIDTHADDAGEDLGALVRRADPDRYLAALYAPGPTRADLIALYAFNHEVAKTRDAVSEHLLGEIRLQWWRETVEGVYAGAPRRHDAAEALAQAVARRGLTRALFDELIDARGRDLDEAPIRSRRDLDDYLDATAGNLMRLSLEVVADPETAKRYGAGARAGAIAYGTAGVIRAIAHEAAQRRTFLPADELADKGASTEDVFSGELNDALKSVIDDLVGAATAAHETARDAFKDAPPALFPAIGYVALAPVHVRTIRRAGASLAGLGAEAAPLAKRWALMKAALLGRL